MFFSPDRRAMPYFLMPREPFNLESLLKKGFCWLVISLTLKAPHPLSAGVTLSLPRPTPGSIELRALPFPKILCQKKDPLGLTYSLLGPVPLLSVSVFFSFCAYAAPTLVFSLSSCVLPYISSLVSRKNRGYLYLVTPIFSVQRSQELLCRKKT